LIVSLIGITYFLGFSPKGEKFFLFKLIGNWTIDPQKVLSLEKTSEKQDSKLDYYYVWLKLAFVTFPGVQRQLFRFQFID